MTPGPEGPQVSPSGRILPRGLAVAERTGRCVSLSAPNHPQGSAGPGEGEGDLVPTVERQGERVVVAIEPRAAGHRQALRRDPAAKLLGLCLSLRSVQKPEKRSTASARGAVFSTRIAALSGTGSAAGWRPRPRFGRQRNLDHRRSQRDLLRGRVVAEDVARQPAEAPPDRLLAGARHADLGHQTGFVGAQLDRAVLAQDALPRGLVSLVHARLLRRCGRGGGDPHRGRDPGQPFRGGHRAHSGNRGVTAPRRGQITGPCAGRPAACSRGRLAVSPAPMTFVMDMADRARLPWRFFGRSRTATARL